MYFRLVVHVLLITGPFGEQDDQQVFVQKVVPETDQLFIRLSSSGKRYVVSVFQSITMEMLKKILTPLMTDSVRLFSSNKYRH